MPNPTHAQIRRIFLSARPHVTLTDAAELLGVTLEELKRDIDDGVIVATSTSLGVRIGREEMVAAAMRLWSRT
jgi:prophage antirepressor-like protein